MIEQQFSALEIAREEILLILNELKDNQNPITLPIIDNELINSTLFSCENSFQIFTWIDSKSL